jgi:hypothetical protein
MFLGAHLNPQLQKRQLAQMQGWILNIVNLVVAGESAFAKVAACCDISRRARLQTYWVFHLRRETEMLP